MPRKEDQEPTQTTLDGAEIPVPTRKEWESFVGKVVKPKKKSGESPRSDESEDSPDQ